MYWDKNRDRELVGEEKLPLPTIYDENAIKTWNKIASYQFCFNSFINSELVLMFSSVYIKLGNMLTDDVFHCHYLLRCFRPSKLLQPPHLTTHWTAVSGILDLCSAMYSWHFMTQPISWDQNYSTTAIRRNSVLVYTSYFIKMRVYCEFLCMHASLVPFEPISQFSLYVSVKVIQLHNVNSLTKLPKCRKCGFILVQYLRCLV
jgi:hypothetical protein